MSRVVRTVAWMAAVTDLFLLLAAFFTAFVVRNQLTGFPYLSDWQAHTALVPAGVAAWFAMGYRSGLYSGTRQPLHRDLLGLTKAALLAGLVMASLAFMLKRSDQSRPLIVLHVLTGLSLTASLRLLVAMAGLRAPRHTHRVIIVGSGAHAESVCRRVRHRVGEGVELVGVITERPDDPVGAGLTHLGTVADCEAIFRKEIVDEVIFAVPQERLTELEPAFAAAVDLGLDTRLMLSFLPNRFARVNFDNIYGGPALAFASTPGQPSELALKRVFDVVVSATALLFLSPVFFAVAVGIKLTSKGPVFFSQNRTGLNGREFKLYKFRSMVVDAEARLAQLQSQNEMSGPVFKIARDPRITGIGHFIRRTSIDELPQFWNVLKGDMSIVGPRPLFDVKQYDERWQCRRLSVKPGITCTWQISGRNQIDFDTWMRLDLDYIDRWSLGLDVKIFLKTIPAVLLGRGAR